MDSELKKQINDYLLLCDDAIRISSGTSSKLRTQWRELYSAHIFAKQTLHAIAVRGLLENAFKPIGVWDVPSIYCLARCMMETFYVHHHICIEQINTDELEFRKNLWELHSEIERLKMLQNFDPQHAQLENLRRVVAGLKDNVQKCKYFQQLPNVEDRDKAKKRKILKGEMGFCLETLERARRAGVAPEFHKMVYKYLSNYAHTLSFSVDQLGVFRAGESVSLLLLELGARFSTIFLALSIRDFLILNPDEKQNVSDRTIELHESWSEIVSRTN